MKTLLKISIKPVTIILLLAFGIVACIPQNAAAYIPGADEINSSRTNDISTLKRSLETKVVSDKLSSLGFTPAEVNERLGTLSDAELHSFAIKADTLTHGSGIVALLILIALLVLIGLTVLTSMGKRIIIE